MSDHKKVNLIEEHEKKYILYRVLEKSTSQANQKKLDELAKQFKQENGITVITDKEEFYNHLKKPSNLKQLEDIKK